MKLIIELPEGSKKLIDENNWAADSLFGSVVRLALQHSIPYKERPHGEWVVTAEDDEGIHRILCPFCGYEKGADFIDYITVTFEKMPPFCENCGAELKGGAE